MGGGGGGGGGLGDTWRKENRRERGPRARWSAARTVGSGWLRVARSEAAARAHGGSGLVNRGGQRGTGDAVRCSVADRWGRAATRPDGQWQGAGGREKSEAAWLVYLQKSTIYTCIHHHLSLKWRPCIIAAWTTLQTLQERIHVLHK
jgi:hypothetical protein